MTHIIILSHFVCITVGCILLCELFRKVRFEGEKRSLVLGIAGANLAFILDTVNIYCRHWYQGYSMNTIVEVLCILLFCFSLGSLFLYLLQISKKEIYPQKRKSIWAGGVFLLCQVMQMISTQIAVLQSIPWTCIGYVFFCVVQFLFLFEKKDNESEEQRGVKSEEIELLTAREIEIARYVCDGKSNREIAEILFISQNTVRNHIYNIYRKLEVTNKIELMNKLK